MLKNDYILRMIEQMAEMIAAIGRSRENGELLESHHKVDEALKLLGVSRTLLTAMPGDQLVWLLNRTGTVEPERCLMLARLMKEDALTYQKQGDPLEAKNLLHGAAEVLAAAGDHDSNETQKNSAAALSDEIEAALADIRMRGA